MQLDRTNNIIFLGGWRREISPPMYYRPKISGYTISSAVPPVISDDDTGGVDREESLT